MDHSDIEFDYIRYNRPRKINGQYISSAYYLDGGKKDLVIKLPYSNCLGEINIVENRCYVEIEIDDEDLQDFFLDLDDINLDLVYKNSKNWFGNQMPLDIVEDYYRPFVRISRKSNYIKLGIPFDFEKNEVLLENFNMEDFNKDDLVSLTIQYRGMRFLKQQFICEWNVVSYEKQIQYEFKENPDETVLLEDLVDLEDTSVDENTEPVPEITDIESVSKSEPKSEPENPEQITIEETSIVEESKEIPIVKESEDKVDETIAEDIVEEAVVEETVAEDTAKMAEEEDTVEETAVEETVEEDKVEEVVETAVEEITAEDIVEEIGVEDIVEEIGVEDIVESEEKKPRRGTKKKVIKYANRRRVWQ